MTPLLWAELLRLRTIRSPALVGLGALVLLGAMTVAAVVDVPTGAEAADVVRGMPVVAVMLVGAFAAARTGGDFARGAMTTAYLVEPRRGRVTAARVATYAIVGALFAGLATEVVSGVGVPVAREQGVGTQLSLPDLAGLVSGAIVAGAVLGAAGALVGTAARNATVASTAIVVWNLVEGLLDVAGVGPYLPFGLVLSLLGESRGTVEPALATVLLAAYLTAGAAATWRWALPRDL